MFSNLQYHKLMNLCIHTVRDYSICTSCIYHLQLASSAWVMCMTFSPLSHIIVNSAASRLAMLMIVIFCKLCLFRLHMLTDILEILSWIIKLITIFV